MDLFSIFKGGKYFDKHIEPKCDYCQFGRRAKDGEKVICEKRGLVQRDDSCSKFIYSPLKRIPVKQLNFVGSLADEDIYIESAGDIAEKQEEMQKSDTSKKTNRKAVLEKSEEKPAEKSVDEKPSKEPEKSDESAPEKTETAEVAKTIDSTEESTPETENSEENTKS